MTRAHIWLASAATLTIGATPALAADDAAIAVASPETASGALALAECTNTTCHVKLTAAQLLENAEALVLEHRFDDAAPFIAALEHAPQYAMERQFLTGYTAIETGNVDKAISSFRGILVNHPEQTRVRLELARALTMKGKTGSADYHYRLAQQDKGLPADVMTTIRSARGVLRSQRQWNFNVDVGIAPDSNISNGTGAETVDVSVGNQIIPLTLDPSARAKSGTGQTARMSAGVRLALGLKSALLIDGDTQVTNFSGKQFDDISAQIAIGPEFRLSDQVAISVQGIGAQRWFGGKRASIGGGIKTGIEYTVSDVDRIGLSFDARRTTSGFSADYSGWQLGTYATYERVIGQSMIASASLFGRRDALNGRAFASFEYGLNLGIGGELPHGITAGISGGVSRAAFDAPVALFSAQARKDWRINARINVGLRSVRLMGFSPAVTYTYAQNASSIGLYDTKRSRLQFSLARYF